MNHETLEMNIDDIEGNHWDIHQNHRRVATHPPPGRPEAGPRIRPKKKRASNSRGCQVTCNIFGYQEKPHFKSSEPKDSHDFSSLMPDSSSKINQIPTNKKTLSNILHELFLRPIFSAGWPLCQLPAAGRGGS